MGFFPRKLFRIIFDLKVKVWSVIIKRLVEVLITLTAQFLGNLFSKATVFVLIFQIEAYFLPGKVVESVT